MAPEDTARALARDLLSGAISAAEGLRKLYALRRAPGLSPRLAQALEPFAELDGQYDLALGGYADPAQVTASIRAEAERLLAALDLAPG